MAFNVKFFVSVGGVSSVGPAIYSYSTDDLAAEVRAADYFPFQSLGMPVRAADLIYVAASDFDLIIRYVGPGEESELFAPHPPIEVLKASDYTIQQPIATDTPIGVTFGPGEGTADDDVMVDAAGILTFNRGGYYELTGTFSIGRVGSSGGTSHIFIRVLINGVQSGNALSALVDNPDIVIPLQYDASRYYAEGDTIEVEVYRDSAGANEGGLFPDTATITEWGEAPSATFKAYRLL